MNAASEQNGNPSWRRGLYFLAWLPMLVFAFTFLGDWFLLAELAVNFQVPIFWGLVTAAIAQFWLAPKYRANWFSAIAILVSGASIANIYLPTDRPDPSAKSLKLMSYNLLASNIQFANVASVIKTHDADVLVVLEFAENWERMLAPLNDIYPYSIREPRWHGFGIALFSKYPLRDARVLQASPQASDLPMLQATIAGPSGEFEFVAIHFVSPIGVRRAQIRNEQFEFLSKNLKSSKRPLVVAGDFNCTVWSNTMKRFLSGNSLRDSRQGIGLQASWRVSNWLPIAIPIDHVFHSSEIRVKRRYLGDSAGSDHRPVIAELAW